MSGVPTSLRAVLALFPRELRERQADDIAATFEDMVSHAAPRDRGRVARRALYSLLRAALAERFSSITPNFSPHPRSRSSLMDDLLLDLRGALRSLSRRPAFAAMVVLTLAIGLGTSAAMFGVVHGVLLEPLPYDEPEKLVSVLRRFTNDPSREDGNMSYPDLRDLQARATSLEALAGYNDTRTTLIQDGEPQLVSTGEVSNGLLRVFGLEPFLGRDLVATDAVLDAPKVVVLGHDFWQTQFGGDPGVLGETLVLSGDPYTIVGVAPAGFDFPREVEVWTPWQVNFEECGRGCHLMETVARLEEGMDPEAASRELEVIGAALEAEYPDSNTYKRFAVRQLQELEVAPVQSALWLLLGAVQLVVLIAAANVANLVLVRGARRRRELAVRTAVGAGRGRLFRQLMLENVLLALGGAAAGLLVGWGALKLFLHLAPADVPRLDAVQLDGTVFAFTAALTLAVLLVFGLVPALRMASVDLRERSGTGNVEGKRSRLVLLTAEVALALVLLLGAGLLIRSFTQMTAVELGFEPERVTRFSFVLPDSAYGEPERPVAFTTRMEERLRQTPGLEAAGFAFTGPFGSSQISSSIRPLDRPEPAPGEELKATFEVATPGFFDTLQIPALRGRLFTDADTRASEPVLVVSQSLAERYFPDRDAVGERAEIGVSFGFDNGDVAFTIVGVVPDVRAYSITGEPTPAVYMAQAQTGSPYLTGLVRARAGLDVMPAVREHFRAMDPSLPLRNVETQEAAIDDAYGPQRFYLALLTSFAGIALLLSAIGLYGVVAYLVSQRTRELAVRMALGADAGGVLRLVLLDALRPAAFGIVLGLGAAFLGAKLLDSLLYGVSAHDALTFTAAPLILIAVAVAACLVPALRASRLEPRIALEEE